MFTKGSKDNGSPAQSVQKVPAPPSLLSADLAITGDIVSAGEIQIDGKVTGNIRTDILIVGESAAIAGEIYAESVRVHGHVNGQINARTVSLAKTAHVLGDILHENLAIEQGAYLEGHCRRIESAKKDGDSAVNLLAKGAAIVKGEPPKKSHSLLGGGEAVKAS